MSDVAESSEAASASTSTSPQLPPSASLPASSTDDSSELCRVKAEKEALEGQYRSLVTKLTTMRQTLGSKLQQDADELDRRATQINELADANDLLKSELEQSHSENASLASDAKEARMQLQDALDEAEQLRDAQETKEKEWMGQRSELDEAAQAVDALSAELESVKGELKEAQKEKEAYRDSAENLQVVLGDFQAAKEKEVEAASADLRDQLEDALSMLAEYKQRALTAESSLQGASSNADRTQELEKQVKEKTLLVGKVRHEAVILNEHLTEALRRLKASASDNNVDRRLVTNVLMSFFNTPRADSKRFEMLQLLASVLQWTDEERESAGLQRSSSQSSNNNNNKGHSRQRATSNMSAISTDAGSEAGPSTANGHHRTNGGGDSIDFAANESFSNLWIEYLLRESGTAAAAKAASASASASAADGSARLQRSPAPQASSTLSGASSPGSSARMANLSLSPPPP